MATAAVAGQPVALDPGDGAEELELEREAEPQDRQDAARPQKSQAAFRTISEVADELDVAQHVLRFWESKFPQVRPLKRGGGRRYYRPEDVDLLRQIRSLLYDEGYTIRGAQKLLRARRAKPPARGEAAAVAVAPAAVSAPGPVVTAPSPAPSARRAAATTVAPPAARGTSPELGQELQALRGELVEVRELLRQARARVA